MMASLGEMNNVLGAGGKFLKPTARRSQKTPYDQPPTSVKNPRRPGIGEDRGCGGGWLSKLVNPAQRLITYTAHKLFASVFRKSLVSGETPLQSPEQQLPERDVRQETRVGHRENTSAFSLKNDVILVQEANVSGNPRNNGFKDLEKVLKQNFFTRSEVDRLTTLIRSKTADSSSTVKEDQRNEASAARYPPSHKREMAHLDSFVTRRSRGRSAIYRMAITPYSRPQSTVKASPSPWAENLSSASKKEIQSGLKRMSSVLDSDIGYVGGPIRRVRQKSNLSSRSLALPATESPLCVRASGGRNMTHTSKDVEDNISGSDFNLVSSMSRELASNILQQVDKTVSPKKKKKSPSKLSPSMITSLQNVAASLDNLPEKKASENLRETGGREFLPPSGDAAADDTSRAGSSKDHETCVNGDYSPLTSYVEEHPPKRLGFRMLMDEVFMDLGDDHSEPSAPFEVAEKQTALKSVDISMPTGEKPLTSLEVMASTPYNSSIDVSQSTFNGSLETGRSQFSALPIEDVQQSNIPSEPTPSNAPAKLTFEGGDISQEEHTKSAAVFPNIFSSPPASTDLLNQNTGQSADVKLEKPSSFAFGEPTESSVNNNASGIESTLNGSITSGGENAISEPQINGYLGSNPSFPPSIENIPSNNSVREMPCTVLSLDATPAASSVSASAASVGVENVQTGMTGSGTTSLAQSAPLGFASYVSARSFGLSRNNDSSNSPSFDGSSKSEPAVSSFGSSTQLCSIDSSASSSLLTERDNHCG